MYIGGGDELQPSFESLNILPQPDDAEGEEKSDHQAQNDSNMISWLIVMILSIKMYLRFISEDLNDKSVMDLVMACWYQTVSITWPNFDPNLQCNMGQWVKISSMAHDDQAKQSPEPRFNIR